ncbi:MAG: 50S ribosomal protein L7/L12 [Acidimicrobiia bacterium]|nr:50S ribosomal protein L7/L12 [Acidimicrobiia bacterium]
MSKVDEVLDTISAMTVLELSELLKEFEERFGVTAAAPVAAMPMAAPAAGAAEAPSEEEEQTAFDVVLAEVGDKKIQVIKEVRALTNLGLKEAKELVDTAPQPVLQGVPREEADGAAEALEGAGAVIQIS